MPNSDGTCALARDDNPARGVHSNKETLFEQEENRDFPPPEERFLFFLFLFSIPPFRFISSYPSATGFLPLTPSCLIFTFTFYILSSYYRLQLEPPPN